MAQPAVLPVVLLALLALARPAPAADDFAYVRSLADATDREAAVVVDTRALADCRARSLAGRAACQPTTCSGRSDGFLRPATCCGCSARWG